MIFANVDVPRRVDGDRVRMIELTNGAARGSERAYEHTVGGELLDAVVVMIRYYDGSIRGRGDPGRKGEFARRLPAASPRTEGVPLGIQAMDLTVLVGDNVDATVPAYGDSRNPSESVLQYSCIPRS